MAVCGCSARPFCSCRVRNTATGSVGTTGGTGTAEINIGGSLLVDNGIGWQISGTGATILSLGNNQMSGNDTLGPSTGSLTPLAGQ